MKTHYKITLKPGSRYTAWVGYRAGFVIVWYELGEAWFESKALRMIEDHRKAAVAKAAPDIVVYEATYEGN